MVLFLEQIIAATKIAEDYYEEELKQIHPKFKKSAVNLIHYRAFRSFDIRNLQKGLSHLGLSRLGKAEAHLLTSLQMAKAILEGILEPGKTRIPRSHLSFAEGNNLLPLNTDALLGSKPMKRPVRIMVTQPAETASNTKLVTQMVRSGMDIARINCAHDGPEVWKRIIQNVQDINTVFDKEDKICMDLGGPKIRVGTIYTGSTIVKYAPQRDENGEVREASLIVLVADPIKKPDKDKNLLLFPKEWISLLEPGKSIRFTDSRGKSRKFQITALFEGGAVAYGNKTAYLKEGLEAWVKKGGQKHFAKIKEVHFSTNRFLSLKVGDIMTMEREGVQESNGLATGDFLKPRISCTSAAVFTYVRVGERVLFDDGKISGKIIGVSPESMDIRVTHAKTTGSILREDKGINFPDTDLKINGLTEVDKKNLPFIAEHADIVNLSFVNRREDVEELLQELESLPNGRNLGIILKIETKAGIENLTDILLAGMRTYPIGLMIARGDLAVECGWENMAMIQEEMLSLCMASHIPVVWATQVLENLAKKGIPSRAEISDAAMSQRAECVMLNKGPHIIEAIKLLDDILEKMSQYQYKKSPTLPAMEMHFGEKS